MAQLRAILFDLDDTILPGFSRPDQAWAEVVGATLDPAPAPLVADAIRSFSRTFWSDPERHRTWRMDMAAARRRIVVDVFAGLSEQGHAALTPAVAEEIADRFTAYCEEQVDIFPDAHDVLAELRAQGLKLALITNGAAAPQRAKIERFDLTPRFDHVQIEGEVGFGKPEERAYRHAMEALGVGPAETWMVGDNLEWEVLAPQRLGIHGVWHDTRGRGVPDGVDIAPDLIIRALSELLAPARAAAAR